MPLVMAAFVFLLMSTWKTGRQILGARLREGVPARPVPQGAAARASRSRARLGDLHDRQRRRRAADAAAQLAHNKVLHARVVLLTVVTEEVPEVDDSRRVEVEALGAGFFRVLLRYGFVEEPDVPAAITLARGRGLPIDKDDITYFLGRETLLATAAAGMAQWRESLFALMSKNAMRATAFFKIPPSASSNSVCTWSCNQEAEPD